MLRHVTTRFARLSLLIVLVAAAFASTASAQDAKISGQILDTSGAVISQAVVTLTRVETGTQLSVASGDEGYYSFPLLLPGKYELKVEKNGFQSYTRTGIVVETATTNTIDVTLDLGAITESVTVEASAPQLQTESAVVSEVVENSSITNLPLIDRRSQQLQRLSGFVVQTNSGANATFAIAGGRSDNANYFIDGGTAQNLLLGVPTAGFDPPVESVQEFSVALSNYAAELGRSGGGVVQMTTRSGTNSFHGSAYEYLRNNDLQATPDFATANPALHYNLFGVSLGGPIKKNKTQFFFNYEGRRQNVATPESLTIPTEQELTGNFNGIIDPATNAQVVVKNPRTGQPFVNNQVPSTSIDSVGIQLAALYPHIAGTSPTVQFIANDPADTGVDVYVGRIDHVFGQRDRIFGRLLAQTDHTLTASVFPTPGTDPLGSLLKDYNYNVSGTWFHNVSPNKVNELRLTYTRRQYLYTSAGAGTPLTAQIGLNTFNTSYFPSISLAGLESFGATYDALTQSPAVNNAYDDDFSWVHGAHQIKFGGEVRTSYINSTYPLYAAGLFSFNNDGTSANTAAGSIANLLLGNVYTATISSNKTIHSIADSYAGFIQDDWKATHNLTLNLGLRYDVDSPRKTSPNAQNSFNPTAINPVSGTPGVVTFSGVNGASVNANQWDLNNFGPRIGFAWSPRNNWVLRGGFGVLYTGEYASGTPQEANLGYGTSGTATGVYNSTAGILSPAFQLDATPVFWTTPTAADLTPGFGAAAPGQPARTVVTYWDPKHVNGYIYQTSFDIQRQLTTNTLIDVSYLGTFGHSLPVFSMVAGTGAGSTYSINQVPDSDLPLVAANPAIAQSLRPFPQFQNVQILDPNIGASKYNGLNVGIDKRYADGLQVQANYTFSRFEDNAESYIELAGFPGDNTFTDYYNPRSRWGLSGNDIRHRLILSGLYELPFGDGKKFANHSILSNQIVGGWAFGLIAELHTGTPLSVIDAVNNTDSFSDGVRPNLVGNPVLPSGARTNAEWFNTTAFQQNPAYTFGNAPRTFGTGPGTAQVDASLLKNFHIHEGMNLQFRTEALNVLNHPNLADPNTTFGTPVFGKVTALQSGNQSRIVQLGLHFTF